MSYSISASASTTSAYFAGLSTVDFGTDSPTPAPRRPVEAVVVPIQQARPKTGAKHTTPKGTAKTVIDVESRRLLEQISLDFVMLTGASAPLAYRIETGNKLSKEGFVLFCNKHYGNVYFVDETGNEVDRASSGDIWWKWDDRSRRVVDTIVMEPTSVPEHEGNPETFNRWYVLRKTMAIPNYEATIDDAAPFIEHLMNISDGDQIGVTYFLCWLAQLYQFPETKIPVAILMYSQFGGVGKNLVQRLLARVFGEPLVAGVSGKRMQSNFMDAIEHKRIIFINELARSDRADGYEDFKTQISESKTQFEGKGRAAREVRNIAHYVVTTNNIDALPLMQNDRRIAVLMTVKPPLSAGYYSAFVDWIEGPGAGIVANLLRTWQFPADWNPHAPAPQTLAALTVQRGAQGPLFAVLEEMCESRTPPFDKHAFTAHDVSVNVDKLYGWTLKCSTDPAVVGRQLNKMPQLSRRNDKVLRKSKGQTESVATPVYVHVALVEWWKGMSPEAKGEYLDTGKCLTPVQTQPDDSEVANHE